MKKLIIAAAIVCAAAMSQAASIDWGAGTKDFVTADGVVHTAATAPAGTFVLVYLGNGTADWSSTDVRSEANPTFGTSMGKATARVSGSYTWTFEGANTPVNGDIFGVMFKDSEGKLSKLETVDGTPIVTEFTISGMGDNLYSGNMTFSSSNYTVASVPEPTSALMLLLGVAGLALRRRRV